MDYMVELAGTYRSGREARTFWQEFGPFPSKSEAWEFIKSQGYTATQKGDMWLAYPASDEA